MEPQSPTLEPLPAPGLAIFPQYVSSDKMETYRLKVQVFNPDFLITHADGRPFLHQKSAAMSMSGRTTITDANTNQRLCQIRGRYNSYYAEVEGAGKLFDVIEEKTLSKFSISFGNALDGGKRERLDFKSDNGWFNKKDGTVSWQGRPVAEIEHTSRFKPVYLVHVAPGLDPFIIIGLFLVVSDRHSEARKRARK